MGNTKSLPVVGEVVTVAESGVKIVAAGALAPFDQKEAAKLAKGAGEAWVEYSEKNIIAGPINSGIRYVSGDEEGAKRVIKSTGKAFESVVDSTPVVGHVKGVVHLIDGDIDHAEQCLIGSTRATVVLGAGLATGGLGAGVVAGGFAGVGSGIAYDGLYSAVDSGVFNERRTHGIWNIDQDFKTCKDANDIADVELSIAGSLVGDFIAGSSAAEAGRSLRKANKIKKQQNDLKKVIKKEMPNVDPDIATRDVIEAGRNLENHIKDGTVKGDSHVSTRVRNVETGEVHQGYNSRARSDINVNNFETNGPKESGFPTKSQAKKRAYPKTSKLMEQNPEAKPQLKRNPACCAEHQAFDSFHKAAAPDSAQRFAQVVSVMFKEGMYKTVMRCKNCLSYAEAMGKVITDKVAGKIVPVTRITPLVTTACKCGALGVGVAVAVDLNQHKVKKC